MSDDSTSSSPVSLSTTIRSFCSRSSQWSPYDHPAATSIRSGLPIRVVGRNGRRRSFSVTSILTRSARECAQAAIAGEFSYSWKSAERDEAEKFERELRLGLWRGLMSPTPILPMTWWWEFHDSRDDWQHFQPVADFSNRMTELKEPNWKTFQAVTAQDSIECRGIQIGTNWFLWVHNRGSERNDSEIMIEIPNAPSGHYRLRQFSTRTGKLISRNRIPWNSVSGKLSVNLPPLQGLLGTSLILDRYTSSE